MKFIRSLFLFVIITGALYSGAWFGLAFYMNNYIDNFYNEDGPRMGIILEGQQPKVSGFPFEPVISYRRGFEYEGSKFSFKEMTLTGFPIPYFPVTLDINGNVTLENKNIKQQIKFDHIKLGFIAPKYIPQNSDKNEVKKWQREIGRIEIEDFLIKAGSVELSGDGFIGLDRNLQPETMLSSYIAGYEEMITALIKQDAIKPVVGAVTLSTLKNLELIDEATGRNIVQFNIVIENRQLSIGPLKIATFPPMVWL